MRASAAFGSLFVATALSFPLKRDYYYAANEVVYVTEYVTALGPAPVQTSTHHHHYPHTANPAPETTSTTTPIAAPVSTSKPTPVSTSTPVINVAPTSTSTPVIKAAPLTTSTPVINVAPTSTSTPVIKAIPLTTSTPATKSAPAPTPKPTSSGSTMIDVVNKWRGKYGLDDLIWSDTLTANALKTGTVDDGGKNEIHHLYDHSYAQVITPGMSVPYGDIGGLSPFELAYVAWLCEVGSDPELNSDKNYCKLVADNLHMSYSDTGHHDILCSTTYKTIGCAFADDPSQDNNTPYQGLWVCDLSMEMVS